MATKMKNGLQRIQFYLTENAYEEFNSKREEFNKSREGKSESKLTESGFCQLKLTGALPRLRGAPKENKNARGRRIKPASDSSANEFSNTTGVADHLLEKQQIHTDGSAQNETTENRTDLIMATGISDDENTRLNGESESISYSAEVIADRTAFQDEISSEDLPGETTDSTESKSRAAREDSTAKTAETGDVDLELSDEEINGLVGEIGM